MPLVFRETQIKTTLGCDFSLIRMPNQKIVTGLARMCGNWNPQALPAGMKVT
jgi:hypothetical protein